MRQNQIFKWAKCALGVVGATLGEVGFADGISYEVTGVASGRLGGVTFTQAPIEFQTMADTTTVTPFDANPVTVWLNPGVTTVTITGVGKATLTGDTYGIYSEDLALVYGPGVAAGGIVDVTTLRGIYSAYHSAFASYHTGSPIGPISGLATTYDNLGLYSTSLGDLEISETFGDATFTAEFTAVPEPQGSFLVAGCLLVTGGVWYRYRR